MTTINPSFTGQINGAGALDALHLKLFAGEVLTAFNQVNVFQDKHQTREIPHGKSASFPATGRIKAEYHTPGTPLLGSPVAHNERVITIDDLLVSNVWVADIDEAKNHYDVRAEYTKQLGEALARVYDRNVARMAIQAARASATISGEAGGTVINAGVNVRTDAALIKAAMFAAAQKFDEAYVPETDRFAFMKPATFYAAAANTDLINKDWGGKGSLADGKIETLAGITIVKSNNVPSTVVGATDTDGSAVATKYRGDYSNTGFLVMQRGAVGTVRLLSLAMQSEYYTLYQATLLAARYAVGHGILRPECSIEIAAVAP
jgi:hypothetical protein